MKTKARARRGEGREVKGDGKGSLPLPLFSPPPSFRPSFQKEKIARRLIVQSLAKHTITLNRPLDSMIKEYGLSVLQFNI